MNGWFFDLEQASEDEEVLLAVHRNGTTSRFLARRHWFDEGNGVRSLKWQDTVSGDFFGAATGPWVGLIPYAFQRLSPPPDPSQIEF